MTMDRQNGKSSREEVAPEKKNKLARARRGACIAQTKGPDYWRSLEELAGSAEFQEMMHREFPKGASEWLDSVFRRGFLQLMRASLATAGLNRGTNQPPRENGPYVHQPQPGIPGGAMYFATPVTLHGSGHTPAVGKQPDP